MLILLITYEKNKTFAEQTQRVLKEKWDLDAEIIMGHTIDNEKYTRTNVLMEGWVDFVLPRAISSKEEKVMIIEDDVRFEKNPTKLEEDADVNWIGFRRGRLTNKRPFITGTQAVVFKREVLPLIYEHFHSKKRKIHLDYGVSKFLTTFQNKVKTYQPKLSYCFEQDHKSLISLDKWFQYTKAPSSRK